MEIAEALELVVGRTKHERYRALVDPSHPDHDPNYINLVLSLAGQFAAGDGPLSLPGQAGPDVAVATPQVMSLLDSIPLAGDVVESIARRIGADRLAAWWTKRTGIDCGCAGRKEAMNRASETLLRWAGR
jgi:hypothetical protein